MVVVGFSIVLVKGLWEVRVDGRRDLDLTAAVRQAVGEKSADTQRKAARFLQNFMNTRVRRSEPADAFIEESVVLGRIRIERSLAAQGFRVVYDTNRIDGSCYVRRDSGSVSSLPVGLAALARLYMALHKAGLRPKANPARVDNWHRLDALDKVELAVAVMGPRADPRGYRGSQYITAGQAPSPLRIEDPLLLGPDTLAAGRAFGWPAAIQDLVTVMSEDGPRWSDTSPLTAADWALSSSFGRTLWAPNKASRGVRTKEVVVSAATVMRLRRSFDEDPARPGMAELEALLAARDFDALERIYLFPSRLGTPHTYWVFNNTYFRPAMEKAGLLIRSPKSAVRPTPHRLRGARIQSEVKHIFETLSDMDEIKAAVDRLMEDVHIKSKSAFKRYVGDAFEKKALQMKIVRFDERQKRVDDMKAGDLRIEPRRRPPSRAQERLRNLK